MQRTEKSMLWHIRGSRVRSVFCHSSWKSSQYKVSLDCCLLGWCGSPSYWKRIKKKEKWLCINPGTTWSACTYSYLYLQTFPEDTIISSEGWRRWGLAWTTQIQYICLRQLSFSTHRRPSPSHLSSCHNLWSLELSSPAATHSSHRVRKWHQNLFPQHFRQWHTARTTLNAQERN